jgi:hypothetical protein
LASFGVDDTEFSAKMGLSSKRNLFRNNEMTNVEYLSRAKQSTSWSNFPAIFEGFTDKGISVEDIKPRENIFTFKAWKALNRVVKKGEKGVKIVTWIPKKNKAGEKTGVFPKTATVFHISQTQELV